jgi:hypothetical protein
MATTLQELADALALQRSPSLLAHFAALTDYESRYKEAGEAFDNQKPNIPSLSFG